MEVRRRSILELQIIQIQILGAKAEIPAANGHGTASGIAKFFGILASGWSAKWSNNYLNPKQLNKQQR